MNCLASLLSMPSLLRQPERRQPVHDAEVHGLGAAAMLGVDLGRRHAEDLRRGERVNVLARR